jgi:uncharacterized membrane protein YphA (DoxX/SURF4 family)
MSCRKIYFCAMKILHSISNAPALSVLVVIRYALGTILLVSGVGKLIDASAAVHFLEYLLSLMNKTSPLAPQTLLLCLSVLEIVLGVAFLAGRFLKPTMVVTNILLGLFTGMLINATGNSSVPTCGCSGAFDFGMPLEMALGRNIVLMAMIAFLWNRLEKSPTLAIS